MRRLTALLMFAFAAQAANATVFAYDSGPVSGNGFEQEVLFSFATDVTDGPFYSFNAGFLSTGLKLFFDGKQYGSGTFYPQGYGGSVSGDVAFLSFTAQSTVSGTSPFGGPLSNPGPPVVFSGKVAAAVPEPAAWLLMLGGFGLVGAAARRQRSTLQPA